MAKDFTTRITLQGNDKLSPIIKGVKQELNGLKSGSDVFKDVEQKFNQITTSTAPLKKQLRELKSQMASLQFKGLDNTELYTKMAQHAGKISDAIGDASTATARFADDTLRLKAAMQGVGAIAAFGQLATSIQQFTGINNSAMDEAIKKFTAFQGILTSTKVIADALNKDSVLMQWFKGVKTSASAASKEVGVFTASVKIAGNAIKTAAKATLILAAIQLAFEGISAAVEYFTQKTDEQIAKEKELKEEQERQKTLYSDLKSAHDTYVSSLNGGILQVTKLKAEWTSLRSVTEKTQWIKDNAVELNNLGITIRSVVDAEQFFAGSTDTMIQGFKTRLQLAEAYERAMAKLKALDSKYPDKNVTTIKKFDPKRSYSFNEIVANGWNLSWFEDPNAAYHVSNQNNDSHRFKVRPMMISVVEQSDVQKAMQNNARVNAANANKRQAEANNIYKQYENEVAGIIKKGGTGVGHSGISSTPHNTSHNTNSRTTTETETERLNKLYGQFKSTPIDKVTTELLSRYTGSELKYFLDKIVKAEIYYAQKPMRTSAEEGEFADLFARQSLIDTNINWRENTLKANGAFYTNFDYINAADIRDIIGDNIKSVDSRLYDLQTNDPENQEITDLIAYKNSLYEKEDNNIIKPMIDAVVKMPDTTANEIEAKGKAFINILEDIRQHAWDREGEYLTNVTGSEVSGREQLAAQINNGIMNNGAFKPMISFFEKFFGGVPTFKYSASSNNIEVTPIPEADSTQFSKKQLDQLQRWNEIEDFKSTADSMLSGGILSKDEYSGLLEKWREELKAVGIDADNMWKSIENDDFKIPDLLSPFSEFLNIVKDSDGNVIGFGTTLEGLSETIGFAAAGVSQLGGAAANLGQAFDSKGLNAAGTIAQAIANLALSYTMALTQASKLGPIAWAAFGISGLAQLLTTIAAVKSATAYADGGIIGGSSFHGDNLVARVNSGEMILNNKQQANLFHLLNNGGSNAGGRVSFEIKGSTLQGVLNNYNHKNNKIR